MSEKNATFTIKNITFKQAETLASWFDGQGEQDFIVWAEIAEIDSVYTDKIQKNRKENSVVLIAE